MNLKAENLYKNLIPCSSYDFPFVDRGSQFSLSCSPSEIIGSGMVQIRSTAFTFQILDSLLSLKLKSEKGSPIGVLPENTDFYPWKILQKAKLNIKNTLLTVKFTAVFISESRLLCTFEFENCGMENIKIKPSFNGQSPGDSFPQKNSELRKYGIKKQPTRLTAVEKFDSCLICSFRNASDEIFFPEPALKINSLSPSEIKISSSNSVNEDNFQIGPAKPCFYSFAFPEMNLQGGENKSINFIIDLSVATYLYRKHHWKKMPSSIDLNSISEEGEKDFLKETNYRKIKKYADSDFLRGKFIAKAQTALLRTAYQAEGPAGEFKNLKASSCVPSCSGFTKVFFWDSLFSSAAVADFNQSFAKNMIKTVFTRQKNDGTCPEHSYNYHIKRKNVLAFPQAPIGTWALEKYLKKNSKDTSFLENIYSNLKINHNYWIFNADRDGDGLAEWIWSGQTADNSPLWDEYSENHGNCTFLPPVASVQLNCFLYKDAVLLANFAEKMNRDKDCKFYKDRAEKLFSDFMKVCYDEKSGLFLDFNHAAERHKRVRTFYIFWPIWADMPVDSSIRKKLIENYLLDSRQFFGDIPFPSLAYDEKEYDPDGYWRGRTWPHISYWLTEMLWKNGYHKEADEAADRLIRAWTRQGDISENMCSFSGNFRGGGEPDYNWGAAALYLLLTEEYKNEKNLTI